MVPVQHALDPLLLRSTCYLRVKVALDLALALLILILAAPVLLVAAILVKWTSPGPILYIQTRLGKGGRTYKLYKFRTMVHNCERWSGPQWSQPNDPRITAAGRWLRRFHLDELPQLWNVLRGEMSLIGPRPERPEFLPWLEHAVPCYPQRLLVRPGLTGLAQVQLSPDRTLEDVRRKLACDLFYVRQFGFWLDLRIFLGTLAYLLGIPFALYGKVFFLPGSSRLVESESPPPAEPAPFPQFQST
jgi:lipopolysaccharide/colanic/teichoic acid biosynthesis glycosyltransferase